MTESIWYPGQDDDFDFDALYAKASAAKYGLTEPIIARAQAAVDTAKALHSEFVAELGEDQGTYLFLLALSRLGYDVLSSGGCFARHSVIHEHIAMPAMIALETMRAVMNEALAHHGPDGTLIPLLAIFSIAETYVHMIETLPADWHEQWEEGEDHEGEE